MFSHPGQRASHKYDVQTSIIQVMVERRSPGEVRDAILSFVSRDASPEITIREIGLSVNESLRGYVAPSSIRSYVQLLEKSGKLKRLARGRYRWVGK